MLLSCVSFSNTEILLEKSQTFKLHFAKVPGKFLSPTSMEGDPSSCIERAIGASCDDLRLSQWIFVKDINKMLSTRARIYVFFSCKFLAVN